MYFVYTVIVYFLLLDGIFLGAFDYDQSDASEANESSEKEEVKDMIRTMRYVTLIDITYTDKSQRTCTGTIINMKIILTAAHCFEPLTRHVLPELTSSFVVSGTKYMFSRSAEKYLKIDKYIIPGDYNEFKSDICLVYTFDPLISDWSEEHVLNIGHAKVPRDVVLYSWGQRSMNQTNSTDSDTEDITFEEHAATTTSATPINLGGEETELEQDNKQFLRKGLRKHLQDALNISGMQRSRYLEDLPETYHGKTRRNMELDLLSTITNGTVTVNDTGREIFDNRRMDRGDRKSSGKWALYVKDLEISQRNKDARDINKKVDYLFKFLNREMMVTKRKLDANSGYYLQNWRKSMLQKRGSVTNRLISEKIHLVLPKECARIITHKIGKRYEVSFTSDYICYSSANYTTTDADAGAPMMASGHLIGMVVAGLDYEDLHVAIGIKICRFCHWIERKEMFGEYIICSADCADKI